MKRRTIRVGAVIAGLTLGGSPFAPVAPFASFGPSLARAEPAPPEQPEPAAPRAVPPHQSAPAPGPLRSFPPLGAVTSKLPNGLELVVIDRPELPLVSAHVVVRAGTADEPADRAGLAAFTAALLHEGTKARTRDQLEDQLETAGGELSVEAHEDATELETRALASELDGALAALADVVARPTLPAPALESLRTRWLDELASDETRPGFGGDRALRTLLFKGTGYGHVATEATLRAVTHDDVVKFHAAHFRPDRTTVVLAGAVGKDASARVAKAFGAWSAKGAAPTSPAPPATPPEAPPATPPPLRIHFVPTTPSTEARLLVAWPTPPRSSPDYVPLLALERLVTAALRGHRVAAHLETFRTAGMFHVEQRVPAHEAAGRLSSLLRVLERLHTARVSRHELDLARDELAGIYALTLERPDGLAHIAALASAHAIPPSTWDGFEQRLAALTPDQLNDAARRTLQTALATIVVAGDPAIEQSLTAVAPLADAAPSTPAPAK